MNSLKNIFLNNFCICFKCLFETPYTSCDEVWTKAVILTVGKERLRDSWFWFAYLLSISHDLNDFGEDHYLASLRLGKGTEIKMFIWAKRLRRFLFLFRKCSQFRCWHFSILQLYKVCWWHLKFSQTLKVFISGLSKTESIFKKM